MYNVLIIASVLPTCTLSDIAEYKNVFHRVYATSVQIALNGSSIHTPFGYMHVYTYNWTHLQPFDGNNPIF